jgi:hypothetical protein
MAKLAVPVAGGQPLRSGPRRVSWQGYLPDWPRPLGRGFFLASFANDSAVLPRPQRGPLVRGNADLVFPEYVALYRCPNKATGFKVFVAEEVS